MKATLKITAEGETPEITVGSVVTWTHVRSDGRGFRFSAREGRVIDMNLLTVTVRYRGGRTPVKILRDNVRLLGQKTALTEAFEKMSES